MSIIGQRIAELRQINGISQERLADILGTGRSTVIRYENGQTYPNSEVIIHLCGIFQVSADYILGIENGPPPSPCTLLSSSKNAVPEIEINITKSCSPSQQSPTLTTPEEIKLYIDQAIEAALMRHKKR